MKVHVVGVVHVVRLVAGVVVLVDVVLDVDVARRGLRDDGRAGATWRWAV